jgi:hypothetical protein
MLYHLGWLACESHASAGQWAKKMLTWVVKCLERRHK